MRIPAAPLAPSPEVTLGECRAARTQATGWVRDVTIAVMATSNGHAEAPGALNREDSQPERHAPGGVTGTRRSLEVGGAAWSGWYPEVGRMVGVLLWLGRRCIKVDDAGGWNGAGGAGGGRAP